MSTCKAKEDELEIYKRKYEKLLETVVEKDKTIIEEDKEIKKLTENEHKHQLAHMEHMSSYPARSLSSNASERNGHMSLRMSPAPM